MSSITPPLWGAGSGKISYEELKDYAPNKAEVVSSKTSATGYTRRKIQFGKNGKLFQFADVTVSRKVRWGAWDAIYGMILLLVFQALILGSIMATTEIGSEEDLTVSLTPALMLVTSLSMYAAWGFAIVWASKQKGFGTLAKDFLVKFKWKHDIIFAIVATIVLRLLEQVVTFLVVKVAGFNIESSDNAGTVASQQGIWWLINAVIVAAFLAPLFEELFFRGLFMQGFHRTLYRLGNKQRAGRSLETKKNLLDRFIPTTFKPLRALSAIWSSMLMWVSRRSTGLALIISSLVFGFMHWPGTMDAGAIYLIAYTGFLGLILGIITLRYKRMGPNILTHILFNLSGVLMATFLR